SRIVQRIETRVDRRTTIVGLLAQSSVAENEITRWPGSRGDEFDATYLTLHCVGGTRRDAPAESPIDERIIAPPDERTFRVPAPEGSRSPDFNGVCLRASKARVTTEKSRRRTRVERGVRGHLTGLRVADRSTPQRRRRELARNLRHGGNRSSV